MYIHIYIYQYFKCLEWCFAYSQYSVNIQYCRLLFYGWWTLLYFWSPSWQIVIKGTLRTSLVVQWTRLCLPMQGHSFEPWSWKIQHATKQLRTCVPQLQTHVLQLLKPVCLEPVLQGNRSHLNEKPVLTVTRESLWAATKTQCNKKLVRRVFDIPPSKRWRPTAHPHLCHRVGC